MRGAPGRIAHLSLLVCLALATLGGCSSPLPPIETPPPDLQIEAGPRHQTLANHLEQGDPTSLAIAAQMVGLDSPGPSIRVILAPESSEVARSAPRWVAGYALAPIDTVVLFPDRSASYPDNSLLDLLRHEVAHILIYRAAGGAPVPRWFNEGVATVAGSGWGLVDRSRVTLGAVSGKEPSLDAVEEAFSGGTSSIRHAYAISEAFVRYVIAREGPDTAALILARVASGEPFDSAFTSVTDSTVAQYESAFWRRHSLLYRWVPILASSLTLWTGITLLALVAARRRRKQKQELYRQWEAEETAEDEARQAETAVEDALSDDRDADDEWVH